MCKKYFGRNTYVLVCAHDLCARAHTHSLKGTLVRSHQKWTRFINVIQFYILCVD